MSDLSHSGNFEYADAFFDGENYREARSEYQSCLEKELYKRGKARNPQRIDYLKRKIEECIELEQKKENGI